MSPELVFFYCNYKRLTHPKLSHWQIQIFKFFPFLSGLVHKMMAWKTKRVHLGIKSFYCKEQFDKYFTHNLQDEEKSRFLVVYMEKNAGTFASPCVLSSWSTYGFCYYISVVGQSQVSFKWENTEQKEEAVIILDT